MTIGDVIHDNIYEMLKKLKNYDYVDSRKDIIIELISQMLLACHLSDNLGLPENSYTNRDINFWRSYALIIYEEDM